MIITASVAVPIQTVQNATQAKTKTRWQKVRDGMVDMAIFAADLAALAACGWGVVRLWKHFHSNNSTYDTNAKGQQQAAPRHTGARASGGSAPCQSAGSQQRTNPSQSGSRTAGAQPRDHEQEPPVFMDHDPGAYFGCSAFEQEGDVLELHADD